MRAVCEKYGVAYKTDTWGRTLQKALVHIDRLSAEGGVREVVRAMA